MNGVRDERKTSKRKSRRGFAKYLADVDVTSLFAVQVLASPLCLVTLPLVIPTIP
jgi:hypothetical protein